MIPNIKSAIGPKAFETKYIFPCLISVSIILKSARILLYLLVLICYTFILIIR